MNPQLNTSLISAWKEQIRQLAGRNPRLAQQLWHNRQYFAWFTHFYRQLANLPRKFRRKFLQRLATTLAGAALLLALGQALPARAATITVDGVTCTLADAINAANTDTATGGCVAGSGADVIDLQTDVLLATALPPVSSVITLEGNGHTLDGNNSVRVLYVQPGGNLTLNETIITGGDTSGSGGGIWNSGTLTVTNSTISNNLAVFGSGIFNEGTLTLNNSTLSGNSATFSGGGIHNFNGEVVVNNSTIINNQVSGYGGGGGIHNTSNGTVNLNNSTLSDNTASSHGGGFNNAGTVALINSTLSGNAASLSGGGLLNISSGTVTLTNSTLSDNTALDGGGGLRNNGVVILSNSTLSGNTAGFGGGILNYFSGTVMLENSTLTGNSTNSVGGGLFNDGTVTLNRSLISGNQASDGPEIYNFDIAIVNANNYNVVGYSGDARSYGFTPGANDIIPPGALNTVLDTTLADNGGPTLTHALVSDSVAIDAAPDAACLAPPINGVDQRGYARNADGDGSPSANECDAGAFEFGAGNNPTPTAVVTATSTATATPTPTASSSPAVTATPPTETPTPTETVTPPTPTGTAEPEYNLYFPLIANEGDSTPNTIDPQSSQPNPVVNLFVVTLLALGNLLLFRKWRS